MLYPTTTGAHYDEQATIRLREPGPRHTVQGTIYKRRVHILDRHGYQAPWIEKKLTKDDVERIEKEYSAYAEAVLEDY